MDVSGCSFLEDDQKAAGFVLTCTRARAIPARASSGASATAPPWPPHGRLPQGSVGLARGSAGLAFQTARRASTPQSRAFFTCRHGQAHFGRRDRDAQGRRLALIRPSGASLLALAVAPCSTRTATHAPGRPMQTQALQALARIPSPCLLQTGDDERKHEKNRPACGPLKVVLL